MAKTKTPKDDNILYILAYLFTIISGIIIYFMLQVRIIEHVHIPRRYYIFRTLHELDNAGSFFGAYFTKNNTSLVFEF